MQVYTRVIGSSKKLNHLLNNSDSIALSYLNLANIDSITEDNDLFYLVDSQSVAKKLSVEVLNPDMSGILEPLFFNYDRILLIGGTSEEVVVVKNKLSKKYEATIEAMDGYRELDLDIIQEFAPELIIVSTGYGKQEAMTKILQSRLQSTHILCCGAFISQEAKSDADFYPPWIISWKVRWLYRLFHERLARKRFLKILKRYIFLQTQSRTDVLRKKNIIILY